MGLFPWEGNSRSKGKRKIPKALCTLNKWSNIVCWIRKVRYSKYSGFDPNSYNLTMHSSKESPLDKSLLEQKEPYNLGLHLVRIIPQNSNAIVKIWRTEEGPELHRRFYSIRNYYKGIKTPVLFKAAFHLYFLFFYYRCFQMSYLCMELLTFKTWELPFTPWSFYVMYTILYKAIIWS